MIALAEGSLPEAEFAAWLRGHITLDAKKRVNEPRTRRVR
jgi:death-on-curing protein